MASNPQMWDVNGDGPRQHRPLRRDLPRRVVPQRAHHLRTRRVDPAPHQRHPFHVREGIGRSARRLPRRDGPPPSRRGRLRTPCLEQDPRRRCRLDHHRRAGQLGCGCADVGHSDARRWNGTRSAGGRPCRMARRPLPPGSAPLVGRRAMDLPHRCLRRGGRGLFRLRHIALRAVELPNAPSRESRRHRRLTAAEVHVLRCT